MYEASVSTVKNAISPVFIGKGPVNVYVLTEKTLYARTLYQNFSNIDIEGYWSGPGYLNVISKKTL